MSAGSAALARRWMDEVWNQRRAETVHELLTAESVGHTEAGDLTGPGPFLARVHGPLLAAFPDLNVHIEDALEQGEQVVVRWLATGTHRGDSLGCPATGRPVRFRGMTWLRCRGGKLIEGWDCWNQGGLMEQLRAGPPADT
jgi:steroid delta-isomerase-like uncharacterized protein